MPSSFAQLSAVSSVNSWANQPTTAVGSEKDILAILPIYGLGDYGFGLASDIDEVVGSAVLSSALEALDSSSTLRILPPLRLGLSPYHNSFGRTDPDSLLSALDEIAGGVAKSGTTNLLFWTTSPWNPELVDTASRDIRIAHSLHTYVIDSRGISLSFHPASPDRARTQALASHLCELQPTAFQSNQPTDVDFRPGNWSKIPPVLDATTATPSAILAASAKLLAELLSEVVSQFTTCTPALINAVSDSVSPTPKPYPVGRRNRYLPALSRAQLITLENKASILVVIPIGAIEQHGPHLPVGVDAMIAESAAHGLSARSTKEVWFGPTLPFGKSNEHEGFAGTLSFSAQSLRRIIKTLVGNLHAEGFRQFAFLNTHGGNSSVLTYTLRELQQEFKIRAGMLRLKATEELNLQERTWGFHAGEWETSVMLAIAPDTVIMDRAICHYPVSLDAPGQLRPENAPATHSWITRDIAPEGVMGDATKATADKGQRWLDSALDQMAEQIRLLLQRD